MIFTDFDDLYYAQPPRFYMDFSVLVFSNVFDRFCELSIEH